MFKGRDEPVGLAASCPDNSSAREHGIRASQVSCPNYAQRIDLAATDRLQQTSQ